MHGLIFAGLRDYSVVRLGEQAAEALWAGRVYAPTEVYADDEFRTLLEELRKATGEELELLERGFGEFAGESTFAGLYPSYYAESADTVAFLLGVEERIHEVVRATIPGAQPPKLHVHPLGALGVLVSYTSERRLCRLLEGLVLGVSSHYGDAVTIDEIQCMRRGDPGCVFTAMRAGAT